MSPPSKGSKCSAKRYGATRLSVVISDQPSQKTKLMNAKYAKMITQYTNVFNVKAYKQLLGEGSIRKQNILQLHLSMIHS